MGIEKLDSVGSELSEKALPDDLAMQEERRFSGDEKRDEQKKQVLHSCFVAFIIICFIFIVVIIGIRLGHLILPDSWCWLSAEKIQNLDKFFFSGTIGGLVGAFIKKSFQAGVRDSSN